MKAESQKQLLEKYPQFFEYLKEYRGPVIPMQFGFECGDGWYDLLDNLMEQITSYTKYNGKRNRIKNKYIRFIYNFIGDISNKLPHKYSKHLLKLRKKIDKKVCWEEYKVFEPIRITQIKEKWGGLCFYYHGGDDYISGMVSFTEHFSYKICEKCGTTENVHQTKGWVYTICNKCEKNKNENVECSIHVVTL